MLPMNEYVTRLEKSYEEKKSFLRLTLDKIRKLQSVSSQTIKYPEYAEAYEYVDEIFPNVGVKEVLIYKATAASFSRYGFESAQGFYNLQTKNIFLSSKKRNKMNMPSWMRICGKIEPDEVIVHELCHYCYFEKNLYSNSKELNEEFAYGWSLGYLRKKGYTDDQIIEYNFLPYLFETVYREAYKKVLSGNGISIQDYQRLSDFQKKSIHKRYLRKIMEKSKEMAIEKGKGLIKIYSKLSSEGSPYAAEKDGSNRCDILDI